MSEAPDYEAMRREDVIALLNRLELEENELSARRARLHDRIDFARLSATNDTIAAQRLEKLLADERALAAERRALHGRVDALRSALRLTR